MICPKCHTVNSDEEKYCKNCGFQLNSSRICPNCNKVNDSNSKYCKECGTVLTPVNTFRKEIIEENKQKSFFSLYKVPIICALLIILAVGAVAGVAYFNGNSGGDDGFSIIPTDNGSSLFGNNFDEPVEAQMQENKTNDTNKTLNVTNDTNKSKTLTEKVENKTNKTAENAANKTSVNNKTNKTADKSVDKTENKNNASKTLTEKVENNKSNSITSKVDNKTNNQNQNANTQNNNKSKSSDNKNSLSSDADNDVDDKNDSSSSIIGIIGNDSDDSDNNDSDDSNDSDNNLDSTNNDADDSNDDTTDDATDVDEKNDTEDDNILSTSSTDEIEMTDVPNLAQEVASHNYRFSSISYKGNDFTEAQCIYIFSEYILNVNNGRSSSIDIKDVSSAPSPSGEDASQSIEKGDYISIASRVHSWIDSQGYVPNYVGIKGAGSADLSPNKMLETFTKAVLGYSISEELPSSVDI